MNLFKMAYTICEFVKFFTVTNWSCGFYREREADHDLTRVMASKGLQLSPIALK